MGLRVAAIIPCFNVGNACLPIIHASSEALELCVIVDDGSLDDTAKHIASIRMSNCLVIQHQTNQGKGSALITGFNYILEHRPDIEAVITLDGDGQHNPDFLSIFIDQYTVGGADLVYGNRMSDPDRMPTHRRLLNTISNRLVSLVVNRSIQDSQCGFRLYSRKLLVAVIGNLRSKRYELETEILIRACRRNFEIAAVPITSIYSEVSTRLSHHSFVDVLRIGKLLAQEFRNRRIDDNDS